MSNENEVASRLLDFTQEPQAYVSYLDSVVDAFYSSTNAAQVRRLFCTGAVQAPL